jgi:hypothetical protein
VSLKLSDNFESEKSFVRRALSKKMILDFDVLIEKE